jgi:glycosyltransferase involved in cell wall biosynthesis
MNKKNYNILFVARDDGGCGFFRCLQPSKFLTRLGLAEAKYVLRTPSKEDLLNADLVVMQDSGSVESTNMARFMMENRIPFMTEYDDFIHHVSPNNLGGYPAWNPSTLLVHRSMEMTRRAAGVTVSTPQLAREYFPYNQNIFVIPNYLDQEKWDQPIVKRNDGKIRIGWCGGNAHADDLLMISKVLDKIVKEYKGKVVFETIGMTRQELAGVFPMKIFNETCPSCSYEGEIHHFPGESLDNYPLVLASKGWDIAVAPVINNSFGNCKSDLKIKEYSASGIPMVASPVIPYKEAAADGAQILFANTFEEWYNCLKNLIEDSEKRSEMARSNKEWVGRHWIQNNVEKIFEVYERVIKMVEPFSGTKESRIKRFNNT